MADILMFKKEQVKNDVWAGAKQILSGEFCLAGIPQELLASVMERMRAISDRWMEHHDETYPANPLEAKPIANLMFSALVEVAAMEGELYRLRNETGAKVS